ncbi:MAG: DUF5662 family protein [Roseburia sp.]
MKAWRHFCTITRHKKLVMQGCFAVGLYWQGLLHDLSKYTPTEFLVGCRYYQGNMSPNNAERKERGYSSAWLHHKGRNRHHMEYWIDYGIQRSSDQERAHGVLCGMKMPVRYVVEMYIDRVAASKNYQREDYTTRSVLDYYLNGRQFHILHEDTQALLELLLLMLAKDGEAAVNRFIREELLAGGIPYEREALSEKAAPYWQDF